MRDWPLEVADPQRVQELVQLYDDDESLAVVLEPVDAQLGRRVLG